MGPIHGQSRHPGRAVADLSAVVLLLAGCSVPLVEGLEEAAAAEVVVALSGADIGAAKEPDPNNENRHRVTVASDDVASALLALDEVGLPNRGGVGVLAALGDGSLVPSRGAERARLLVGTAGELEQSLREVSGVLSARVHLAVPENDPLAGEAPLPPSAAVLLRHSGATPPLAADDVRRLVAGAVAGLRPEGVAVVMHPVALGRHDSEGRLARLGPLSVARSSLAPLRWSFVLVAALNAVLVLGLVFAWLRLRQVQRERGPREEARSEGHA